MQPIENDSSSGSETEADEPPKTEFYVGRHCESRAILYHDIVHYKRNVLESCEAVVRQLLYVIVLSYF